MGCISIKIFEKLYAVFFLKLRREKVYYNKGQATISFILLLGGIIMEVAIAGALVVYFVGNAGVNERLLSRARNAAYAGVRDMQLKIIRNKDFSPVSAYHLNVGDKGDYASTTVSRILEEGIYQYSIVAQGIASRRYHTVNAKLLVDAITGLTQLQSFRE